MLTVGGVYCFGNFSLEAMGSVRDGVLLCPFLGGGPGGGGGTKPVVFVGGGAATDPRVLKSEVWNATEPVV